MTDDDRELRDDKGQSCATCETSFKYQYLYDDHLPCRAKTTIEQPAGSAPTEVFVLLADGDGTTSSSDSPFGVAVTTEEEAQRFVREGGVGYSHSYVKVRVFADKDAGLRHAYPKESP
jgi:hypothetical protein